MKKRWLSAAAAAMVLMIGATSAVAWGGQQGSRYVDANGDGICDNRAVQWTDANGDGICDNCAGYVDANGDGICDNRGTNGRGAGYVDANGDGVCDNRAAGGMMRGTRGGMGRCAGGGCMR